MVILMLVLGLGVLTAGAELLVRNASKLAVAVGISPLVVGLTVVAFGTSAPELVVSIQSTLAGQPDVALGNVVGSNIFNVLFILGVAAVIVPLRVSQQLIRFDVPLMVCLSLAVLLLSYDGRIGRLDGLLLTTGLISYTLWAIVKSRKEQASIKAEYEAEFGVEKEASTVRGSLLNAALLIAGLLLLVSWHKMVHRLCCHRRPSIGRLRTRYRTDHRGCGNIATRSSHVHRSSNSRRTRHRRRQCCW